MEMSQVGLQCGLGGSMTYEEVWEPRNIDEGDRRGGGSDTANAAEWD